MERWDEIAELFDGALKLPASERDAWLASASPDVRREVEAMLQSSDEHLEIEERFLSDADPTFPEGVRLGSYRIRKWLGRGGMGDVYLGERAEGGFEQLVAIKVLRRGVAGAEAAARFRRERRILAHLTHPAVAPLLDSGVAPDGRPFLVLQYIDGEPITRHCEAQRLSVDARLRLFVTVCRAVQYAHGRLIIHRDLKPSNILVTKDGEARLLDFGIAKVLAPDDADSQLTRHESAPMTPERAAPEQLRGEVATTATDVWALGVLLFEMLTGRLPFAVAGRTRAEIEREITDREAPATAIKGLRDLDTVIAKALRREPEQRYASAGQLADDVERVLAGQPILARPQSVAYRIRRFVGRNRAAVAASALAIVSLIAFAIATAVQSRQVARERDRAAAEEVKANSVVELLTEVLRGSDPTVSATGPTIDVNELLARGETRALELIHQPAVQARLWHALGLVHLHRTNYAKAKELLSRAYAQQVALEGADDLRALEMATSLAHADEQLGFRFAARARLRGVVARLGARARPDLLAEALLQLSHASDAPERKALVLRSLALRRALVPPRPIEVAASLDELATYEVTRGARREAAAHYREAFDLLRRAAGPEDLRTLEVQNNLALVVSDPDEQEALFRDLIDAFRRRLGDNNTKVAQSWNNLGIALAMQGRHDGALAALAEARDHWSRALGPKHPQTESTRRSMAILLDLRGEHDEAIRIMRQVIEEVGANASLDRGGYAQLRAQVGKMLLRAGHLEESRREIEPAWAEVRRVEPAGAANRTAVQHAYALLLLAEGRAAEAEKELRELLDVQKRVWPADDVRIAEAQVALGRALVAGGRVEEGRAMIRESFDHFAKWGLAHPVDVEAARSVVGSR